MDKQKYVWKKVYTIVLIANAVYIVLFYVIKLKISQNFSGILCIFAGMGGLPGGHISRVAFYCQTRCGMVHWTKPQIQGPFVPESGSNRGTARFLHHYK